MRKTTTVVVRWSDGTRTREQAYADDETVRVWDPVAGHYTRTAPLSDGQRRYVRGRAQR